MKNMTDRRTRGVTHPLNLISILSSSPLAISQKKIHHCISRNSQGVDSADEATGLTPDWSREASGDEDDDASLMEFLPEGVTRMPSINPKRR